MKTTTADCFCSAVVEVLKGCKYGSAVSSFVNSVCVNHFDGD